MAEQTKTYGEVAMELITLSAAAHHLAEVTAALKRWEDSIWSGQQEPQPAPLSLMQSVDSALRAVRDLLGGSK